MTSPESAHTPEKQGSLLGLIGAVAMAAFGFVFGSRHNKSPPPGSKH